MEIGWLSLIPPLIVLLITCITHRLNTALILGIIASAFIASSLRMIPSLHLLWQRFYLQVIDIENLYLYAFLFTLGGIIAIIEHTGGAYAFAHKLSKKVHTARMAELSSMSLSLTLFIDDYLNCLTVGYVMHSITDRFKIARNKLAFLVHSLTSPLVILAPLSTWIAFTTSQVEQAGISPNLVPTTKIIGDPYFVYISAIPFILYSLLLIASVATIIIFRISYGPMKRDEDIALATGNLFGGHKPTHQADQPTIPHGKITDLIIPIVSLIGIFIIGIAYTGNYYLFGGNYSFVEALQHNKNISLVLVLTGFITFIITLLMGIATKRLQIKSLGIVAKTSINLMLGSIILIFLAKTLSEMIKTDLKTGNYLASLLGNTLSIWILPFAIYITSLAVSLVLGSAWGTIAIMTPIGIPLLMSLTGVTSAIDAQQLPLLLPILGAIFSGAVCGNHISPIADLTIITATSTGTTPLSHAYTQFWYAVPALISAGLGYLLLGLLNYSNPYDSLLVAGGISLVACIGLLITCNALSRFRQKP